MKTSLERIRILAFGILFLAAFLCQKSVYSYPSFIGYGYNSCLVCHFNPFGNGPLTDYGRALGATAIAAKPPTAADISDQRLGELSGFLGSTQFPDFLRLSADYRGLQLVTPQKRFINMQAEMSLILLANENQSYFIGTLGYIPSSTGTTPNWISREHSVSFKMSEKSRLSLGFQDVVFGIRIPDHTAYSRVLTKLAQNDQVHGATWHIANEKSETGFHLFAGNLYQTPASIRPIGVSLMHEWDLADKVRFGLSSLYSKSQARERILQATHLRAGVGKGSSVMMELGFLMDTPTGSDRAVSNYGLFQSTLKVARGWHFMFVGEYKTAKTFKPSPRIFRVGPAIQYFPMQRLEFRTDFSSTRTLGAETPVENPDTLTWSAQVHLWL
jgi:hypothetical protein